MQKSMRILAVIIAVIVGVLGLLTRAQPAGGDEMPPMPLPSVVVEIDGCADESVLIEGIVSVTNNSTHLVVYQVFVADAPPESLELTGGESGQVIFRSEFAPGDHTVLVVGGDGSEVMTGFVVEACFTLNPRAVITLDCEASSVLLDNSLSTDTVTFHVTVNGEQSLHTVSGLTQQRLAIDPHSGSAVVVSALDRQLVSATAANCKEAVAPPSANQQDEATSQHEESPIPVAGTSQDVLTPSSGDSMATTRSDQLARTGSHTWQLVSLGAILLVCGSALVRLSRIV